MDLENGKIFLELFTTMNCLLVMMKKLNTPILISFIALLTQFSLATSQINYGGAMGGMYPDNDSVVKTTFGKDFYWQGYLGLKDTSGFEIRASLGHYGSSSINPADLGSNFRVSLFPLTASLIYHVASGPIIQPYFGGGVGGYFYDFQDDIYGDLETGIRFGFHALGGVRVNLSNDLFLTAEYKRHFIPKLFFNNAQNFDTSEISIGMGFYLPINNNETNQNKYKYTNVEEDLLVQIQQCKLDIIDLETQRDQWQKEIDEFYLQSNYNASDDFTNAYQAIKFKESQLTALIRQIDTKKAERDSLNKKWIAIQPDEEPVEQHIMYLQRNYIYSPYGLNRRNNVLIRRNRPYIPTRVPAVVYQINNNQQSASDAVEDKKEFIEKKKERLQELKNRQ